MMGRTKRRPGLARGQGLRHGRQWCRRTRRGGSGRREGGGADPPRSLDRRVATFFGARPTALSGLPPQSQNLEFSTRDLKKLEFWKAGDRGRPRVKLDSVVVDDDASAEELKLRSVSFGQGARALRRAGWQTDLKLKLLLRRPSGRRSR